MFAQTKEVVVIEADNTLKWQISNVSTANTLRRTDHGLGVYLNYLNTPTLLQSVTVLVRFTMIR